MGRAQWHLTTADPIAAALPASRRPPDL